MYECVTSQVRARGSWRNYVALLRFHYHCSFCGILLGALVVTRHWHGPLLARIVLLYVSMNVLLVFKSTVLGAIVLLWIVSRPTFQIPYIVTACSYVVCVGGIEAVPRIRSLFERLWLR